MQWDATPRAGFTSGEPWLPIAEDCGECNVQLLQQHPRSMLTFYKRLIDMRHARLALSVGTYKAVFCDQRVLAYERSHDTERLLIALNFSDDEASAPLTGDRGTILLSTHLDREGELIQERCVLRAHEAVIITFG